MYNLIASSTIVSETFTKAPQKPNRQKLAQKGTEELRVTNLRKEMITVLQVDVKGNAKIKESFLGQTWVYALSVQKNKTECYTIYKKWNEIYDLHNRLAKDYPR